MKYVDIKKYIWYILIELKNANRKNKKSNFNYQLYENYSLNSANEFSKNIEIVIIN